MASAALLRKAEAKLELDRRQALASSSEMTVYGIYDQEEKLLRCWQHNGIEHVLVDKDPVVKVPLKLEKFLTVKKRFKVAIGGRGGGKSQTILDLLLSRVKDYGHKIGCFRQFQNSIEDSVHPLLSREIDRLHFQNFEVQNTAIFNDKGGEFKFKGLSRNIDSVQSMFGFNVFHYEEAQTTSEKSLIKVIPTLRAEDSEHWFSLNPQSSADPISQRFIKPFEQALMSNGIYEDEDHLIVLINYMDNPWFPHVLEQDRRRDEELMSRAMYNHVWLGHFNDEVENSIIPVDWFDAAIDAHVKLGFKPAGAKVVAHDPSDLGNDAKGLAYRHGSVFLDIRQKDDGDVNEGQSWATDYAINVAADYFTWDCDGLGVSLKRDIAHDLNGKPIKTIMFKGSESPEDPDQIYQPEDTNNVNVSRTNKETFRNKRAQYYWRLRDRFYNTYLAVVKGEYINPDDMISLSSNIEQLDLLRSEVCRIPLKPNGNGYIQIMNKLDMAKLDIASPNMSDAMMMALLVPKIIPDTSNIDFDGW